MNIVYVSALCSKNKNEKLMSSTKTKTGQQVQKFHWLLTQGLQKQEDVNVYAVSVLPINRKMTSKRVFAAEQIVEEGITYFYISFLNFPVLRQISIFFQVIRQTFSLLNQLKGDLVLVCDVLNFFAMTGALIASRIKKVKIVGIVTDIPTFRVKSLNAKGIKAIGYKLFNNINLSIAKLCDAFILITEEMNKIMNKKDKNEIVMECLADSSKDNSISSIKHHKFVCLYSGGLLKEYGIDNLVHGFLRAKLKNAELHIYGGGAYEEELIEICKGNPTIKFFGYVENSKVVQDQMKASLLINPRPTTGEFTKYSFPIKNMEYMSSGTPTLTTCLAGMPKEYYDYVFLILNESKNGIADAIAEISKKSNSELRNKGTEAMRFVMKEKNNFVQAKRVVHFLHTLINK